VLSIIGAKALIRVSLNSATGDLCDEEGGISVYEFARID